MIDPTAERCRRVETTAELDELPDGSVILDGCACLGRKHRSWFRWLDHHDDKGVALPAILLWHPDWSCDDEPADPLAAAVDEIRELAALDDEFPNRQLVWRVDVLKILERHGLC